MVFGVRVPGQELAGLPELEVDRPARGRRARAAGLGAARTARHAGARSDRRRDARQPVGTARDSARPDAGRARRRVRTSRRRTAARQHRRNLPHARRCPSRTRPGGCCCSPRPTPQAIRRWCGGPPRRSGIGFAAAGAAIEAGLAEFGTRVRFRHPLVRSAIYWSASPARAPRGARRPGGGHRSEHSTLTAAPGTWPRPRPGRMRTSPRISNARPSRRRPGAGWPRPPRSSNAQPMLTARPGATGTAGVGRRAGTKFQAGAFDAATALLAMAEARTARRTPASPRRPRAGPARVRHQPGR